MLATTRAAFSALGDAGAASEPPVGPPQELSMPSWRPYRAAGIPPRPAHTWLGVGCNATHVPANSATMAVVARCTPDEQLLAPPLGKCGILCIVQYLPGAMHLTPVRVVQRLLGRQRASSVGSHSKRVPCWRRRPGPRTTARLGRAPSHGVSG